MSTLRPLLCPERRRTYLQVCGDLNEKGVHGLICLNVWYLFGGTIWMCGLFGGGVPWGVGFEVSKVHTVFS